MQGHEGDGATVISLISTSCGFLGPCTFYVYIFLELFFFSSFFHFLDLCP